MIKIDKVGILNFRIYEQYKEFDFSNKKFILLSGPNGYGKTTLLYAIEWCLTGSIGKLKESYEVRNSTKPEKGRVDNKSGFIINKNALRRGECAKVTLVLDCEGKKIKVSREQREEGVNNSGELKFETENISKEIKEEIQRISDDKSFYKYQMCDIQKVYKFLDKSRSKMKDEFIDFTKDKSDINELIENLEQLEIKYNDSISDVNEKIIKESENLKKEKELHEKLVISNGNGENSYPVINFYENEKNQFNSIEDADINIENLKNCAYNQINLAIDKIENNELCKKRIIEIKNIINRMEINKIDIKKIQSEKIYDVLNRQKLEKELLELKNKFVDINKGVLGVKESFSFNTDIYNEYLTKKHEYDLYEEKKKKLSTDIELEEQGNEIIKVLSDIVSNINGIKNYRNEGNLKCPVCGSEQFSMLNENAIGNEASLYLNKVKSNLENKKKEKKEIELAQKEIDNAFRVKAKKAYEEYLKLKENNINEIKSIWQKYADMYAKIANYIGGIDEAEEDIVTKLKSIANKEEQGIISEEKISKYKTLINDLVKLVEFKRNSPESGELSKEEIILIKREIDNKKLVYKEFYTDIYAEKIMYLKRYIEVEKSTQYTQNINKIDDLIKELKNKNKELEERKTNIHNILDKIKKKKSEIQKEELSSVGQYIYNIYRKIIKHSDIKGIMFKKDSAKNEKDSGAVFTDEQGNNLLNIMSDGQISIFVLSYFIGNIIRRKQDALIQSYFIDDITSCMDDINMIAFVDLMKNMLSDGNGAIKQLFFSTCNHNIELLFQNHMMGLEIPMVNVKFPN